ncbi:MAG: hypothetical protein QOF78_4115 [Phycisphaerales bacterium]|nr:hypothetical protein [Phycisphaerales bacterium]
MNLLFNDEALIRQLGWTLLHTLWQGVVFAACLALLLRLMRGAASNVRYVVACGAMGMVVISAILTFALLAVTPLAATPRVARPPETAIAAPTTDSLVTPPLAQRVPAQQDIDPLRYIVTAWFAGVAAMALWHVGGWLILVRLRRGQPIERLRDVLDRLAQQIGVTRAVRLLENARVDVPAVIGVLRPVILVPIALLNDLSPQQVEAILAHELAHICRHDYLINLIQSAIETLLFYHPATWWISMNIRRERENCCDDIAAHVCGDGRAYAAALAALEQRRNSAIVSHLAPAATGAGAGGDLLDRVRRVLKLPPLRRRISRTRSIAAAALALACVVLPLFVTAAEKPSPPTTTAPTPPAGDMKTSPITADDLKPDNDPYRISKNDLVAISITGLVAPGVESVKVARVSESGKVALPNAGDVTLAGLTVEDARDAIVKAYATILHNPDISLTLQEARGRMFSILGGVARPGQYQITQPDFRVLDALVISNGELTNIGSLMLIRGADKRVLAIPPQRLASGDLSVNAVIRGGDMLIASPREKRFLKIVVGKDDLRYGGKFMDIAALGKLLGEMSEAERHHTVLEVSAASPDITVERFFSATAALHQLVEQHGLANLSQTGIQPPTTAPSTRAAASIIPADPDAKQAGEYYINGIVQRVGVYSITGPKITLKQAIAAAGGFDDGKSDALLTIVRRRGANGQSKPIENVRYSEIASGAKRDAYVQPNDVIQTRDVPPSAATLPGAAGVDPLDPGSAPAGSRLQHLLLERRNFAPQSELQTAKLGREHPRTKEAKSYLAQLDRQIADERAAAAKAPVEQIATVDATMREYVNTLEQMEFNLERLKRTMGQKSRVYIDAQRDVELQKKRIDAYAAEYRRQFNPGSMLDTRHRVIPVEPPPATQP